MISASVGTLLSAGRRDTSRAPSLPYPIDPDVYVNESLTPAARPRARRAITIRSAILRGSLTLVLIAIVLSGSLSFVEFRRALQSEIARNLAASAVGLQERLEVFFFERIEDLREWRQIELLQDIKVGDVDKRLARLLGDLRAGHGDVYRMLYCTNGQGRIVAASDPLLVGAQRPPGAPMKSAAQTAPGGVVLELSASDAPEGAGQYVLRTPVLDEFGSGTLGYLYAVLNWGEVNRFLSQDIGNGSGTALLLDGTSRVIAAGGALAQALRGKTLGRTSPAEIGQMLIGSANSPGYQHFGGFGWRIWVIEPIQVAFAPVWRMAWITLGVLVFSLAVAGWLSVRFSARLARPIGRLTDFARDFRRGRTAEPPSVRTGISEVGELSRAFGEMVQALERSREHLVRAGKLAVVGEMAAIMAHEVRTPLGILKSSVQILERRQGVSSQDHELIGFIVSETDRLNRLVTTLLECASPRSPQSEPHDLHGIVQHVLAMVGGKAEKNDLRIETSLAARRSILDCDREQMIQVFLNLVINAIQHVPEGGVVRIDSQDEGEALRVQVEDDGPGIPFSEQKRVFDPFYTRREGGIGLGLTIVQQIVQTHGGNIEVKRSDLGGAAFVIRFDRKGDKL